MSSEELKLVKKQENDNNNSSGPKKVATSNAKPQSNKVPKVKKEVKEESEPIPHSTSASRSKVKKQLNDDYDEDDDDKPIAKKISSTKVVKEVKKKKKVKKEEEEVVTEQKKKKKEKKVYDLPGQKRDPPEERDPLRVFYETLYEQIPTSEMSQIWLMETGLLPKEVAVIVHEKKQKKTLQQKITSPVKAVSAVKSSTKSVTVKKKVSTTPKSSVKKTTPNSASKQSNKQKPESVSSDDDSDFTISSAMAKRRKVT
ncbi:uncharacterized protein [Cicer arietinum]|uniref:Nucleolar protein 58 n=1 Tax=Cicer arietinum TaxID=3827 RepID=A0A1S2Y8A0_CICAR|nr:nucleolar protein 58 [Cicer arietinum]